MTSICVRLVVFFGLIVLLGGVFLSAKTSNGGKYLVYVGTYTGPSSKGVYVFSFDPATGKTTTPEVAAETMNPSYVAGDPSGRYLYAVNEVSDYNGEKSGAVSAFSIDPAKGTLKFLNQVSSRGAGPCYVSVDKTGKFVLVANYDSGSVAVFPIEKDGKLGSPTATIQHTGRGADPERQGAPHAHQIEVSPDNRFAIAADLGLDKLLSYKFDAKDGKLAANDPAYAAVDAGSGPRHFVFTPNGKFLYVLEEMRSAVTGFSYDAPSGILHPIQTISSIPADFHGKDDAAEIAVHPSGKFVYASNRGHDSIAAFAIAPDGRLSNIGYESTQGKTPRGFAVDPTGSYLLAANQASNNIVVFRIDAKTGRLNATGAVIQVPTPVCVQFVRQR